MFQTRSLVIATKHKKETVISPLIEKALGVTCFVNEDFDTDELGTFTGEIERIEDPVSTVKRKCLEAMELSQCDLGIASEGSFGAHPTFIFANADDEIMIFIDKKNNLEILAREISTSTNFNAKEIFKENELLEFATKAKFPSHGLILRKSKEENTEIFKGITNRKDLLHIYKKLSLKYPSVYVETDMRAMYNPTRMLVIESLTKKLIDKINSKCPKCNIPGFGVREVKKGLPCELCGYPTQSTLSLFYECSQCHLIQEQMFPNNKETEDPQYCDYCNP
jgi:hypothetical protein